jgi:hypothetical protein
MNEYDGLFAWMMAVFSFCGLLFAVYESADAKHNLDAVVHHRVNGFKTVLARERYFTAVFVGACQFVFLVSVVWLLANNQTPATPSGVVVSALLTAKTIYRRHSRGRIMDLMSVNGRQNPLINLDSDPVPTLSTTTDEVTLKKIEVHTGRTADNTQRTERSVEHLTDRADKADADRAEADKDNLNG